MTDLLRRPGPAAQSLEPWEPAPDDPRPDAVLFDMDGTLLDTETIWAGVVGSLVRAYGGVWLPDDDVAVLGWSVPALCAEIARRGVPLPSDEVARSASTPASAPCCAAACPGARARRPSSSRCAGSRCRARW
jgi:hypothetical protein